MRTKSIRSIRVGLQAKQLRLIYLEHEKKVKGQVRGHIPQRGGGSHLGCYVQCFVKPDEKLLQLDINYRRKRP